MKICLLSEDYPSPGNPICVFVQQLVEELVDNGVQVCVIAPQSLTHAVIRRTKILSKYSLEKTSRGNTYELYRPYDLTFGNHFQSLTKLTDWLFECQLNQILKAVKPDVLYGHFWHVAFRLRKYAYRHRMPLFVACGEGDDALEYFIRHLSQQDKQILTTILKGVISSSSENKRKCIEYGLCEENQVILLPNCVNTQVFKLDKSIGIRTELGATPEDFVVIYCGDFQIRKGANRLAEAIEQLNDDHIKSIFIGREVPGDTVDVKCNGILFKGRVEHSELPKYLNTADIFVLPTRKEGCCNAIVEALACGLPVVSSSGSFNDDILNTNNSIRVDPNNIEQISYAIKTLKEDERLRRSIVSYLEETHESKSISQRAKAIISFIESRI